MSDFLPSHPHTHAHLGEFSSQTRGSHKLDDVEHVLLLGFIRGPTCSDIMKKVKVPRFHHKIKGKLTKSPKNFFFNEKFFLKV